MAVLQHHFELERGLDGNNEWHIVCRNGSIDHNAGVLIVEDEVRVFSHPHLDTLGVIGVFHVEIFLQQTADVADVIFREKAVSRGDQFPLVAELDDCCHMHVVNPGNWHPGEVQVVDELPDLLRNVLGISCLVMHSALVVHYDSCRTNVLDGEV